MKRFLDKITNILADAALLEMGVEVKTVGELHSKVASETGVSPLKLLFQKVTDTIADAALLEMGVAVAPVGQPKAVRETLEENLIEIAFAEAGDYDQIHNAILREHRRADDMIRPDDCGYGDNEVCFA
jgi:hypothetical protein